MWSEKKNKGNGKDMKEEGLDKGRERSKKIRQIWKEGRKKHTHDTFWNENDPRHVKKI